MTEPQPSSSDRLKQLRSISRQVADEALVVARRVLVWLWHWLGIAARKTWIVLKRLPIATYSFARALLDADYAHTLTDLYIARESTAPPLPAARTGERQAPAQKPPVQTGPQGKQAARAEPPPAKLQAPPQPPARLQEAPPDSALVLLALLQKEGRLLDFLQEEITGFSDQDVGAAARVVHQGCQRVLSEYLSIAPVREEAEGSRITLGKGFDASAVRPTGNVVGDPPFTGSLVHRGWRAVEVRLPRVASSRDVRILAAAEVEL